MCNSYDWYHQSPFHSMCKFGAFFMGSNPKLNFILLAIYQYTFLQIYQTHVDASPHSLKNSNASLKMKTTKEGIGVHSLICNTSRVEGHVGALEWGLG